MKTLTINLLPVNTSVKQKEQKKFRIIQIASTAVLLILIFLASITAGLRILQAQNIKKVQAEAAQSESDITSQKDKESEMVVLKSRLGIISQYYGKPSKQNLNYSLVSQKISPSIDVSSISVDRQGNVLLSIVAPDSNSIDSFIESLTNAGSASGISKVEIESLSRNRDPSIRADLRLAAK